MAIYTQLTSSEIATLWTQYMNDTAAICMNKYVLKIVEDLEIREIYEQALQLSNKHVDTIINIFKKENLAVPVGFTAEDVNLETPRLYSDAFHLYYLYILTMHGLTGYSLAITTSNRQDILKHFMQSNASAMELYEKIAVVFQSKGLDSKPPYIPYDQVDFVKSQSFLNGWFGERRPLNAIEINSIYSNLKKTIMVKALLTGFSQVAKTNEVIHFITNAIDVARKHIEIFSSVLNEDDLTTPIHWDSDVNTSTDAPFSDKLMMFHTGFLTQTALGYYGAGLATTMRPDIVTHYGRTITEDLKLGEDWANIMINHGWLEQIPQAPDRKALAYKKK